LEHFKKFQVNLEFHQNKCHPGGVPDTKRQCEKATDQWAQGVAGRPHLAVTLSKRWVEGNPKLKVGGAQTTWPVGHVARPTGHHLACYRLNQVGNPSLDSYKYPLPVEVKATQSTCSSPLVKVPV
jgi:hypothetical protein